MFPINVCMCASDEMAKKDGGSSKKNTAAKVVEDKTFGMKNKNKSAKVGKYIEQVKKQASGGKKHEDHELKKKGKKEEERIEPISKVLVTQKVPAGVDPKSLLCQLFKKGECNRGDKCKFSHDMNVERRTPKIDLYSDQRTVNAEKKVPEVSGSEKPSGGERTSTDIVCKYFLKAVEDKKYGWFWECPNGGEKCQYRHALPPGYEFPKEKTKSTEEEISMEEFLEKERHRVAGNTLITEESFRQWKASKMEERKKKIVKKDGLSGKDLFNADPARFSHEDDEEALSKLECEVSELRLDDEN